MRSVILPLLFSVVFVPTTLAEESLIAPPELLNNPDWIDGIVPPDLMQLFTPMEYVAKDDNFSGDSFYYRLYQPENLEEGHLYPILVWTSGYGEMGDNNFAQLRHLHLIFRNPKSLKSYPFYCLVMQVPKEIGKWADRERVVDGEMDMDMAEVLMRILDGTLSSYPIDKNRIYLSGVSIGGTVCWELAQRYPDRFAAVAPLAGSGSILDPKRLDRIKHVPIWAFHSKDDPLSPIQNARETVRLLKDIGGTVHLTEIDTKYHDCWTSAFQDYKLMDWMLAQERDQFCCWLQPGTVPGQWWGVVAKSSVVVVFGLAIIIEIRRRKRIRSISCTEIDT